ncbi:unnamed protein product, partial [Schistosoma spindalis]
NSSNVNVPSKPTLVEHATTTSGISESELENELENATGKSESELNSSNVNASSKPTLVEHVTTTSGISESELENELENTTEKSESELHIICLKLAYKPREFEPPSLKLCFAHSLLSINTDDTHKRESVSKNQAALM